ncbi:MAG TPA: hypothetical protein PK340_01410 [Bacilli bacterium]|nr:hypothetical protein [Bacilli bacterium]
MNTHLINFLTPEQLLARIDELENIDRLSSEELRELKALYRRKQQLGL